MNNNFFHQVHKMLYFLKTVMEINLRQIPRLKQKFLDQIAKKVCGKVGTPLFIGCPAKLSAKTDSETVAARFQQKSFLWKPYKDLSVKVSKYKMLYDASCTVVISGCTRASRSSLLSIAVPQFNSVVSSGWLPQHTLCSIYVVWFFLCCTPEVIYS